MQNDLPHNCNAPLPPTALNLQLFRPLTNLIENSPSKTEKNNRERELNSNETFSTLAD